MTMGQLSVAYAPIRQIMPTVVAVVIMPMGQIGIRFVVVMRLVLLRERMRVPDRWRRNGSRQQQRG